MAALAFDDATLRFDRGQDADLDVFELHEQRIRRHSVALSFVFAWARCRVPVGLDPMCLLKLGRTQVALIGENIALLVMYQSETCGTSRWYWPSSFCLCASGPQVNRRRCRSWCPSAAGCLSGSDAFLGRARRCCSSSHPAKSREMFTTVQHFKTRQLSLSATLTVASSRRRRKPRSSRRRKKP